MSRVQCLYWMTLCPHQRGAKLHGDGFTSGLINDVLFIFVVQAKREPPIAFSEHKDLSFSSFALFFFIIGTSCCLNHIVQTEQECIVR